MLLCFRTLSAVNDTKENDENEKTFNNAIEADRGNKRGAFFIPVSVARRLMAGVKQII